MTSRKVTVLGCGSSAGVPRPNGDWGACDPKNRKNYRTRASILFEQITADGGRTSIIFDTGPDFRQQMISTSVTHLDAIVYTHGHADHIHGIDDVRSFVLAQGQMLPAYADDATYERLTDAFDYIFATPDGSFYPPILTRKKISAGERFSISGDGGAIEFLPIYQDHGSIYSLGFRADGFAYCPDVSGLPASSLAALSGLDVLIIDALQYREHVSHFSLRQALAIIEELEPKQAFLTHMHTPLDYDTVSQETPENVQPCFDGLEIELDGSAG